MESTTALHEIGHYIAWVKYYATDFGLYDYTADGDTKPIISTLSINPDKDSLGHMLHDGSFYYCNPVISWRILLAGYACEFIVSGQNDKRQFLVEVIESQMHNQGSDAYILVNLVCAYNPDYIELLEPEFNEVVAFLQTYWKVVTDCAYLLSDKGEINGLELRTMGEKIMEIVTM